MDNETEQKQPTAMSAERYILMHKIDTLRLLAFASGVTFGVLFMFLVITVLNMIEGVSNAS